jgi:hypothetical protein
LNGKYPPPVIKYLEKKTKNAGKILLYILQKLRNINIEASLKPEKKLLLMRIQGNNSTPG